MFVNMAKRLRGQKLSENGVYLRFGPLLLYVCVYISTHTIYYIDISYEIALHTLYINIISINLNKFQIKDSI